MTKTVSQYLEKFLQYIKIEQKCSPKTLQNYNFYLNRFVNWYGTNKKLSGINLRIIKQYQTWLSRLSDIHSTPLKKNTQNYHLIALRSFLKYLSNNKIRVISSDKIALSKTTPAKIVNLGEDELSRLLEAPLFKNIKDTKIQGYKDSLDKIQLRDKVILEILYSTGLRVSELTRLKRTSKLILSSQARYWLDEYLKTRTDQNPYLFISYDPSKKDTTLQGYKAVNGSQALTARSIQRIVQKYAKLADIKMAVTPHTLRHSHRVSQSETD